MGMKKKKPVVDETSSIIQFNFVAIKPYSMSKKINFFTVVQTNIRNTRVQWKRLDITVMTLETM